MMKNDDKDHKTIEHLKNLPKINDSMSKEELYNKVSSNMTRNKTGKRAHNLKNKFIPIFSTALVVVILLILIPSFVNNNEVSAPNKNNVAHDNDSSIESANRSNMEFARDNSENEIDDKQIDEYNYYLLPNVEPDSQVVYAAFPDNQIQYVVPVTFVLSKSIEIDDVNKYFEGSWGDNINIFDEIVFNFDNENEQVVAHLSENFTLGDGSSRANVFTESLSFMFTPMGFEKVTFTSDSGQEGLDLGPIGTVTELDLHPLGKAIYKLYQPSDDSRKFLVPIRQDDTSFITDAFDSMKQDEETFNLEATIPSDIIFELDEDGNQLTVSFTRETILYNSQQTMTMIEAMLATAKTYGYEDVSFTNISLEEIGKYDLTKPIAVPEAINPIYK